MTDEVWAMLVDRARDHAACSAPSATCYVRVIVGPLYALINHYDMAYHRCQTCSPGTPQHMVSVETLQRVKRDELVARVARWLSHAHDGQLEEELRAA